MKTIHVVGSLNVDYVISVDRIAQPGETILGGALSRYPGGKGANQAVAAANLGAPVRMIGQAGEDLDGRYLVEHLARSGVDTSAVVPCSQPSGAAFVQVLPDGNNSIVVSPGANAALTADTVCDQLMAVRSGDLVMCQLESPLEATQRALEIARDRGATSILDPAPARPLSREFLELVDYLTPNETEAACLLGRDLQGASDALDELSALGAQEVVLKMGAHGAWFREAGQAVHIPAHPVRAVDTTAAGDTFNAALAVGLIEASPLLHSIRFACAAAAISVTRHGAQTSCPTRDETTMLLRSNERR